MLSSKKIKDMLQGKDILKCIQSLRIRCYGRVERLYQQQTADQLAAAAVQRTKKEGDKVK